MNLSRTIAERSTEHPDTAIITRNNAEVPATQLVRA